MSYHIKIKIYYKNKKRITIKRFICMYLDTTGETVTRESTAPSFERIWNVLLNSVINKKVNCIILALNNIYCRAPKLFRNVKSQIIGLAILRINKIHLLYLITEDINRFIECIHFIYFYASMHKKSHRGMGVYRAE